MMIPVPVRVVVMVSVLVPVLMLPLVMFTVGTLILFSRVTVLAAELLLMVKILNVVAPLMVTSATPAKLVVPVAAVNVPLFTKFEYRVCVKEDALKVVDGSIVKIPFVLIAPPAVLVLPFVSVRRW